MALLNPIYCVYDSSRFLMWSCSSTVSMMIEKKEKDVPFYHYANRGSTKGLRVGSEAPW